jgi:anaerobic selenocysteine-containing dehydrogenase
MRADTKKKHKMGRRFAILIGVAAAGVMALGAQTALAGGESVDSTPPDLQLSGPKKQDPQNAKDAPGTDCPSLGAGKGCDLEVGVSCDEVCTVRVTGS